MQRLAKAGTGPVSIQLLASFNAAGASNAPLARVGYYTPGSTSALDKTELFTLAQGDVQTTNPTALGATSFDPGSSTFGLYTIFPHFTDSGHPRVSYSEDALNTWDANVPRKVRFFPLENPDGSIVPNAYVFAFEDNNIPFGSIQPYDSNDVVGIIRNVMPAADAVNAPVIGVENLDGAPASNRMVFNRIQVPNATLADMVHDTGTLLIRNTGSAPLTITSLALSDTTNWMLVNPPTLPATVAANGGTLQLTVQFIAQKAPTHTLNETNDTAVVDPGFNTLTGGGVWTGTLTIGTNDPSMPAKVITLAGYWPPTSEHEEEPGIQTLTNMMFGYTTVINALQQPNLTQTTAPVYYGEELVSPYWNVADASSPVTAIQLVGFHQQYDNSTGTPIATAPIFAWYAKGSSSHTTVIHDHTNTGQMLFPILNTGAPATASFSPTGTFGFDLDGNFSDDSLNLIGGGGGHHVRFYPVRDANGRLVANTYLVGLDYGSATFENYDFQDLMFLVSNIKPTGKAPAPTDAQATTGASGINLQWAKVSDSTLIGYNVYRGSSVNGTFTKLNSSPITTTNYLDAFAPAGVTSYYRITAVDSTSESVGAAPTALTATALSTTQIKLTWTASAGASSYRIEREALGDASFVEIAAGITATSFTDSGLFPNTTYVYQIRAQNSAGLSAYSTVAVATTKSGTVVAPGAPGGLTPSLNAANQVVLTWTASTGSVSDYRIERQGPSDSSFVEIASGVTGTSYTDATAGALVTYNYRVRAANGGLFSGYSGVVIATPGLYAPLTLGAAAVSQSQINLNWTLPAEPMTAVHIERSSGGTFAEIGTTSDTTYQDATVVAGTTYTYRIRIENSGAFSPYSPTASATATAPQPSAFTSTDINMSPAGSTNVITDGKDYDVAAGGTGVYGAADSFRFVYEPLTGDFDVSVQIANITAVGTGINPQAGLAARSTLDAGSPTVALTASPTGGYRFKTRSAANGAVTQSQTGAANFPAVFIRMTRAGNLFTTYYSTDGSTWTKYGSVTLALGATVDVGMATTSTTLSAQTTAQFRGFANAIAQPTPPTAPANLQLTTATLTSIAMSWTASTGTVTEYRVERMNPDSTWSQISPAGLTATTFTDTGLTLATTYHYRVYAVNSAGSSPDSNQLDASTLTMATAPSAPGTPTAAALSTTSVSLSWAASTGTVTAYHVERAGSDNVFTEIAGNVTGTSFTDTTAVAASSYTYRVRAENSGLLSDYGATAAVTTPTFDSADIGASPAGSTIVNTDGSSYDVTAGGPGVYSTADGFRFLSQLHTGDFDIRVQVAGITTAGVYPQAGLMARSTLAANSPEVSITASSTASAAGIFRTKSRATAGAATTQTQTGQATFPNVWLRLTRVGNVFTTYYSSDGITWTKASSVTVALPSTLYIGLGAASNDTTDLTSVQFRNFSEQ